MSKQQTNNTSNLGGFEKGCFFILWIVLPIVLIIILGFTYGIIGGILLALVITPFVLLINNTEEKAKKKPNNKFSNFMDDDDLGVEYEFIAEMSPHTPLNVLKHHGKKVKNKKGGLPNYTDNPIEGVWLPCLKDSNISKPENEKAIKTLDYLKKFRKAVESELKHEDKKKVINQLFQEYDDLDDYLKPEEWYLWELSEIPGVSYDISKLLYQSGIKTKDNIRTASDKTLLNIEGIGKKRLEQIRTHVGDKSNEMIVSGPSNEIVAKQAPPTYVPKIMQKQGLQILESLHVMEHTKNIDTLIGRYEFLEGLYKQHLLVTNNERFTSDMQKSIDHYKSTFYERVLYEHQLSLLIKPNLDNLKWHYAQCLAKFYQKFSNEQTEIIESLKKDDAKTRRLNKLIYVGEQVLDELGKIAETHESIKELSDIIKSGINNYSKIVSNYNKNLN